MVDYTITSKDGHQFIVLANTALIDIEKEIKEIQQSRDDMMAPINYTGIYQRNLGWWSAYDFFHKIDIGINHKTTDEAIAAIISEFKARNPFYKCFNCGTHYRITAFASCPNCCKRQWQDDTEQEPNIY